MDARGPTIQRARPSNYDAYRRLSDLRGHRANENPFRLPFSLLSVAFGTVVGAPVGDRMACGRRHFHGRVGKDIWIAWSRACRAARVLAMASRRSSTLNGSCRSVSWICGGHRHRRSARRRFCRDWPGRRRARGRHRPGAAWRTAARPARTHRDPSRRRRRRADRHGKGDADKEQIKRERAEQQPARAGDAAAARRPARRSWPPSGHRLRPKDQRAEIELPALTPGRGGCRGRGRKGRWRIRAPDSRRARPCAARPARIASRAAPRAAATKAYAGAATGRRAA